MRDDAAYLLDILLAAHDVQSFISGLTEVDLRKVWDAAQHDLPPLIAMIEPLVPPEE